MSVRSAAPASLRRLAAHGLFWAAVQSWGNRVATFLLAILLARILSPEEFGIAAAAWLVLILVPLVAELGFGHAILQRRDLRDVDVTLPFVVAGALAFCLVAAVVVFRAPLALWAGLGDRTGYLVAIAATVVISVPTAFQEAMYKRRMWFRALALRAFAANICGGLAAVFAALSELGVWSFVVQAHVILAINVVWIWARPAWRPGRAVDLSSFAQMFRFGLPVLGQRLVDFAGTRTLDVIIISQVGLAAYGLYVVGAKLYQTMMDLLQSAFFDVSVTVLSTIAEDCERIAGVYLRAVSLSASFLAPLFVLVAAVAPEVCAVLFGNRWTGVDAVARPLLLLGAVQCVQYMNGAFLTARGRPDLILVTGLVKSALQIVAVIAIGGTDVGALVWVFVAATLLVTPLSFTITARQLGLGGGAVLRRLGRPAFICALCFGSVMGARAMVPMTDLSPFVRGVALGGVFAVGWAALLAMVAPMQFAAAKAWVAGNR